MIITVQIEDIAVQIVTEDDKNALETAKQAALDVWKKKNCYICDEDEQETIN